MKNYDNELIKLREFIKNKRTWKRKIKNEYLSIKYRFQFLIYKLKNK